MVADEVNVLEQVVRVHGGVPIGTRRGHVSSWPNGYSGGGYAVKWTAYTTDTAVVELQVVGPDASPVVMTGFDTHAEAEAEFERIRAELFTREWVEWVTTTLTQAGIVPAEFRGAVLAGELIALLGATDWQDEHDNPNAGLLLRAAYYRIAGQANVTISAGKGTVAVLNPQVVTKRSPVEPGIGMCRAAVVVAGKSVRIVSVVTRRAYGGLPTGAVGPVDYTAVEERIFRLGDQAEYGSFNLVYYGPVTTITAKTVVVEKTGERSAARLSLATFVEKNHDFDLAKAKKRNDEWTD